MICGNCKTQGVTVNHVRDCYDVAAGKHNEHGEPFPVTEPIPTLAQEPFEGVFYKAEHDTFYKVLESSTGNFYAKEWANGEWIYAGRGPLYHLTALDKVTAEQAARFGKVTSHCVFCARKLTDDRSIAVGYGEICAENNGLPWGETDTEYQLRYQREFGRADNE